MARLVAIPVLVFLLMCTYALFEVQILKALVWMSGDGMINWFAITRLVGHEQFETVGELTQSKFAKTRLFAIWGCDSLNYEPGLKSLPQLIDDPVWEVRMEALRIAQRRRHLESGPAVLSRLANFTRKDADTRQAQFERTLLVDTLMPCSSRLNAESLAQMAITTGGGELVRVARTALWSLGALAEAEKAYTELLRDPELYGASFQDQMACLKAVATLELPQAFEQVTSMLRDGPGAAKVVALECLASIGGPKAKKVIEGYASQKLDEKRATPMEKDLQAAAKRALRALDRKEKGLPPEDPAQVPPTGEEPVNTEDLLSSYGSDATTAPAATSPPGSP